MTRVVLFGRKFMDNPVFVGWGIDLFLMQLLIQSNIRIFRAYVIVRIMPHVYPFVFQISFHCRVHTVGRL